MFRSSSITAIVALTLLATISGCVSKSDIEEIRRTQKEIVAKLDKAQADLATMETKIDKLQADFAKIPIPQARPQIDFNKVYDLPVGDSLVRGPKSAPVTITMFSDFQCPYCSRMAPIVEEVLKAYPNDVNFVMKQFPLRGMHPNADPAARAALAAGKQGKFWEMHDELYKNAQNLVPDTLKSIAEKLTLDVAKWQADMDSDEVKKAVDADLALGQKSDVRGTPTVFINGKMAMGRSVDDFKRQIDALLKNKAG